MIVVFGHSIILYSSQWALYTTSIECLLLDNIKKVINIIQMPLFFSLSGFCFFYTVKRKKLYEIIKDKFKRLLIPFLIFSVIWLLPIRYAINYPRYSGSSLLEVLFYKILLGYDNGHLWFLPTLFLCFLLAYICLEIVKKFAGGGGEYICIFFIGVILYCEQILFPIQGYIQFVGQYYIWFCVGLLISYCKNERLKIWDFFKQYKYIFLFCCVVSIVLALLKPNIIYLNISSFICVMTCYLIILDKRNKMCLLLSENSFGIYLIHSPLVYITFEFFGEYSPLWVIGINFILWGGISLIVSAYLRKTKLKWIMGE